MLMKKLTSRRGEGYIDVCIGVVVFVMILVVALNLFEFVALKVEMDRIADELIQAATYSGEFGDDYNDAVTAMRNGGVSFAASFGADRYFNSTLKRVQLGNRMWVTVTVDSYVKGLGIRIPVTLTVKKTGLSERYWKAG